MPKSPEPDEKEKRIVVRLPFDRWKPYDDKRHAEGLSFQEIGEQLWCEWWQSGTETERHSSTEQPTRTAQRPPFSADESLWIQKLLNLLRSPYSEAAKYQIEALRALNQVEEIAHDAKTRGKGGTEEFWAKALEAVRAVRHPLDVAQRKIGTGAHPGRHRKGDDGDSG